MAASQDSREHCRLDELGTRADHGDDVHATYCDMRVAFALRSLTGRHGGRSGVNHTDGQRGGVHLVSGTCYR